MAWGGAIKRDKYDALFSFLVRERANWKCEYCLRDFRHDPHSLHCSHVFGRRKQSVRCHPDNAMAHCIGCHRILGENPVEFARFVMETLGEQRYERLKVLANKPTKFTKADKELIHKHYLAEKAGMVKMREEGFQGRIEFSLP